MPRLGNQLGDGVFNTYSGMEKGTVFKFFTKKELNQKKTIEAGTEQHDNVDFVEYANDYKTRYCARVDQHTLRDHPDLYPHYQKWKEGRKNDLTDIREWNTISPAEMVTCMNAGFFFVEQIVEAPEDRLYALGSGWKELKQKADITIRTKNLKKDQEGQNQKFAVIEQENLSLRQAVEEMKAQLKLLAENKAVKKGRPKKEQPQDTELVLAENV